MSDIVTIAIHTGLKKWLPLLENSLKSFLICNTYPNVEIMIIESGQNQDVRDWLKNLDFYSYVNFDGTKTTIKPHQSVKIQKTLLFPNFEDPQSGIFSKKSAPYIQSLELAFQKAQGKYFTYMAEDHQFIPVGDVISNYIKILETLGADSHIIPFLTTQRYKLAKKNNAFQGPFEIKSENKKDILYFEATHLKWEQYMFCKTDLYKRLGPIKDWEKPHGVNNYYTEKCRDLSIKRLLPAIPACCWFPDNKKEEYVKTLKEKSENNPDFVLFKTWKLDNILGEYEKKLDQLIPMTSESFSQFN